MMATVRSSGATTPFAMQQPKLDSQMFAIYLANSVRRDVLHLAAVGAIKESDKNAIFSYLPRSVVGIDDEDTLYGTETCSTYTKTTSKSTACEPARVIATPRRTPRQRSETAPQQQIHTALQSPRSPKTQKFEGLGAKLGALFGKFNVEEAGRRSGRLAAVAQATPAAGAADAGQPGRGGGQADARHRRRVLPQGVAGQQALGEKQRLGHYRRVLVGRELGECQPGVAGQPGVDSQVARVAGDQRLAQ
ncbi:hypothetical protein DL89DRAFT_11249 [Linderina pennispora]|uniref:Uncharacterized protein n=1 Tax=Linderina pennispora TaxID=61395 RepID=A0A1Y1WLD8_9FUNG|nr:uncharacterized protein DL89DRAFT_11249 [Linderina pennispora]ORX74175.1 hypothetical protein DL89DRAFT_11249 [Linderina pennispora]